jgi:hypothetical protein
MRKIEARTPKPIRETMLAFMHRYRYDHEEAARVLDETPKVIEYIANGGRFDMDRWKAIRCKMVQHLLLENLERNLSENMDRAHLEHRPDLHMNQ